MVEQNKHIKEDIAAATYRLFMTNGYSATTYRDIAEAVGRDRTLVQYHFPHKELLVVGCLRRLIDLIEEQIAAGGFADRESSQYRVVIAQIYFAFLMEPGIRRFTLDVLSNRAISHEILVMEANWNLDFLAVPSAERDAAVDQAIIAVGGAYELIYHRLVTGGTLDIGNLARETIATSATGPTPVGRGDRSDGNVRYLSDTELAETVHHLIQQLTAR